MCHLTTLICYDYLSSGLGERMSMEHWWNDADRDNIQHARRKTNPSATLSTTNRSVEKVQYDFHPIQNIKIWMNRTTILPVVLYGCET